MTWGSPASQSDTLRKLGRRFPENATDLVVVLHALCDNPIARLVSPQRPRWLWGPVLVSREPTEVPGRWPGTDVEGSEVAGTDVVGTDADDTDADGAIDFFQLVQGLTIPGRIDLWCTWCASRDQIHTRALRAAAKRATDGTVERIRTASAGRP